MFSTGSCQKGVINRYSAAREMIMGTINQTCAKKTILLLEITNYYKLRKYSNMKIRYYSYGNKTNFCMKSFALSPTFKMGLIAFIYLHSVEKSGFKIL